MITLIDNGNSIKFTFENCPHYLYNGTIEVPKNSLSIITDESGMVTFKKSASNDIFVSCLYSELGMTKSEIETWYKQHGVKEYVDEGEVDEQIATATQNYFDGAEYDSNSKRINFKHGNTIKGYIDASDFVIDGMVDDVEIENGYLVITFNTDSGKQPISIPLTDIFNPNNYYDKTATDALLATKADTATTYTKTEVDAALSGKQDTLIAGSGITISGNVISAEGGNNVVTLTQAEYDALVDKDPTAFYIISDAEEIDVDNYYTKSETSGATQISTALSGKADTATTYSKTEVDTALSGKQDTLIAGENITISGNVISAEGGGKAISGGTNISITTGETADTINCTLPISATTLGLECFVVESNSKTGNSITENNFIGGSSNKIGGNGVKRKFNRNFIWGQGNQIVDDNWAYDASSTTNIICGWGNKISGANNSNTSIFGYGNESYENHQTLFGYYNKSINGFETSFGQYNNSVSASTTFGDSGNTLFAVGNGHYNGRHNGFEIRQNGDVYIVDTNDTSTTNWYQKPMIKLQDQLGGGSSYTAGDGIDITNDVISVTGKVDTSTFNTYSGGVETALSGKADTSAVTAVNDVLTAHTADTSIHLDSGDVQTQIDNSISSYSATVDTAIEDIEKTIAASLNELNEVKADVSAVSGKVDTSTFNTYSGSVETALSGKQDTLSAGTGINITDNVISATGGGGKAISGGTNISITTGETADTINCTLPLSGKGSTNIVIGDYRNTTTNGNFCLSLGYNTIQGNSESSIALGQSNNINVGYSSKGMICAGGYNRVTNNRECAFGQYNVSNKNDTDSGNTLFSVGNGTANDARHNAFEIRQNGDIYCSDGTNDVKLQDTITATAANTTALGGLSLVTLTQAQYDALATKDNSILYIIVN